MEAQSESFIVTLWEFVKHADESDKPVDKKQDSVSSKMDTAMPEVETEKVDFTWRENQDLTLKKKNRAYTIIYESLIFQPLISSATDGARAWKILHDHFVLTTHAWVIQLLDVFFSTRYVPSENLGLFLCHMKQATEWL